VDVWVCGLVVSADAGTAFVRRNLASAAAVSAVEPAVPVAPVVPLVVPVVVPDVPVVLAALEGAACRHPVTVTLLSELELVVLCGDGGVAWAPSVMVAMPKTAAKLPDQVRNLMLPPRRLATCNHQTVADRSA
jgi:hypothetical protein